MFVAHFEEELSRPESPFYELRTNYWPARRSLLLRTLGIDMAVLNAYFAFMRPNRKLWFMGNLGGLAFALVNFRYHLFDDIVELLVNNTDTQSSLN